MEEQETTLLQNILRQTRVIAVVGLGEDTARPSYDVASYMQRQGYRIIPIHPQARAVLGEQAYPDLLSVPFAVDMVDIFRRPEAVGPHVDEAIQKGAKSVWMQLGIRNEAAAQRAREAGLQVVMDRCVKVDHMRLMQG